MSKTTEGLTMNQLAERNAEYVTTIEQLQQKLIESERYGRQTDITIDNLEMKLAQMAAELNAVEAIHTEAVFITDEHYEQCPPEVQKIIRSLAVLKIPAYQAFLAEVRAQGVEMFAKHCQKRRSEMMKSEPNEAASNEAITTTRRAGEFALYFATQLRKGGAA